MRKRRCLMVAMLLVSTPVYAGFNLPREVYTFSRLKRAQAEARQKNKALTILYTKTSSTCPLNKKASLDAVHQLKSETIIVYADSKKGRGKLPKIVAEALSSPKAGKYVPKVVVLDPDMTNVICIVPYARNENERKKLFQEAKKRIAEEMAKKIKEAKELWLEGRKLMEEENYAEAIKCFEKAKRIAPTYSPPYYRLGLCYEQMGDTAKALENYKKYLELIKWKPKKENIRKKVRESIERLESSQEEL